MQNIKNLGNTGKLIILTLICALMALGFYGYHQYRQNITDRQSQNEFELALSKANIVNAPAESVDIQNLPVELQNLYKTEVTKYSPGCTKNGQIVNSLGQPADMHANYAPIGAAIINVGCTGGADALFAKDKEGAWRVIAVTENTFKCDDVFNNPVPKKLLEMAKVRAECLETTTGKVVTYDEALNTRYY